MINLKHINCSKGTVFDISIWIGCSALNLRDFENLRISLQDSFWLRLCQCIFIPVKLSLILLQAHEQAESIR